MNSRSIRNARIHSLNFWTKRWIPELSPARTFHDAACLDADPDLFFPVDGTGTVLDQADIAKRICLGCPVQKRCLTSAMELGFVSGIWGGTTERERSNIRRASTRQRRGTDKAARTHD